MEKPCQQCGLTFQKDKRISVATWNKRKYCSSDCFGKDHVGENNPGWQDEPSYFALHCRVRDTLGKANMCSNIDCDKTSTKYHWSNISGLYKQDLDDYQMLCVKCHKIYDLRFRTHCKRDHELTPENVYISQKKVAKECRTCRREANVKYFQRKKEVSSLRG